MFPNFSDPHPTSVQWTSLSAASFLSFFFLSFVVVLRFELGALYLRGRLSTTWVIPPVLAFPFEPKLLWRKGTWRDLKILRTVSRLMAVPLRAWYNPVWLRANLICIQWLFCGTITGWLFFAGSKEATPIHARCSRYLLIKQKRKPRRKGAGIASYHQWVGVCKCL